MDEQLAHDRPRRVSADPTVARFTPYRSPCRSQARSAATILPWQRQRTRSHRFKRAS
jgi:hypothetical protein